MVKTVVLVTCETDKAAEELARELLEKDIVASISIINNVRTFTKLKEESIEESAQDLLVAETDDSLLPKLVDIVNLSSNGKLRKVVALPISGGSWEYISMLSRLTSKNNR